MSRATAAWSPGWSDSGPTVGDLAHKMAIPMVNKTEMMIHLQIFVFFSQKTSGKTHSQNWEYTLYIYIYPDWGMVINPLGTNPHSVG